MNILFRIRQKPWYDRDDNMMMMQSNKNKIETIMKKNVFCEKCGKLFASVNELEVHYSTVEFSYLSQLSTVNVYNAWLH